MNQVIREQRELKLRIVVEGARAILRNAGNGNGWREEYTIDGIKLRYNRQMLESTYCLPYGLCSLFRENGKINCHIMVSGREEDRAGVLSSAEEVLRAHDSGKNVAELLVRESYDYSELREIESTLGKYHTLSEGFEEQPDADPETITPKKFLRRKKRWGAGNGRKLVT